MRASSIVVSPIQDDLHRDPALRRGGQVAGGPGVGELVHGQVDVVPGVPDEAVHGREPGAGLGVQGPGLRGYRRCALGRRAGRGQRLAAGQGEDRGCCGGGPQGGPGGGRRGNPGGDLPGGLGTVADHGRAPFLPALRGPGAARPPVQYPGIGR